MRHSVKKCSMKEVQLQQSKIAIGVHYHGVGNLYFPFFTFFFSRLFCLPLIINDSIHVASGSGDGYFWISYISLLDNASTRFAASIPVTQARSKKNAGVSCRTQSPAQKKFSHGVSIPK